jgi:hypothetical protein
LVFIWQVSAQGKCEPYAGGVELCNQFYKTGTSLVYIGTLLCIDILKSTYRICSSNLGPGTAAADQASISALVQPQALQLTGLRILAPQCFFVAAQFLCTSYFPNCSSIPINASFASNYTKKINHLLILKLTCCSSCGSRTMPQCM